MPKRLWAALIYEVSDHKNRTKSRVKFGGDHWLRKQHFEQTSVVVAAGQMRRRTAMACNCANHEHAMSSEESRSASYRSPCCPARQQLGNMQRMKRSVLFLLYLLTAFPAWNWHSQQCRTDNPAKSGTLWGGRGVRSKTATNHTYAV